MEATVKVVNSQGKTYIIEYEYIKEPPQKIQTSIDGCVTRYGNLSRWVDSNGQEPINEIRDLLDSEIGEKIQCSGDFLELVSKK